MNFSEGVITFLLAVAIFASGYVLGEAHQKDRQHESEQNQWIEFLFNNQINLKKNFKSS